MISIRCRIGSARGCVALRKATARGRGRLFVISAPSGAGKTSLVRALMAREPQLKFSISCTTRKPRENEVDGRDYYFVPTLEDFRRMADAGEFLEHAQVFDNYYATPRRPVEEALGAGQDLILEIDWQGARQVRAAMPDCVSMPTAPNRPWTGNTTSRRSWPCARSPRATSASRSSRSRTARRRNSSPSPNSWASCARRRSGWGD